MTHRIETDLRHRARAVAFGLGAIALLLPVGMTTSAFAQEHPAAESPSAELGRSSSQLVAQFGGIRIPRGGSDDAEDAEETPSATSFSGFSGEASEYVDDYNGFQVSIPAEFELGVSGQSTNWTGPILNDGAVGIYVNAAPLPGVDSGTLLQTYQQQYEQDRFYTDVVATTVPYGDSTVPALRVREVNNRQGSRDEKAPDDIHRWHLFVFGNGRVYTWGFTGMYQTFQDNLVQETYEDVISSVELVPIVE
ncbi:MAG: hypothetical protein WBA57_27100 [Elainellaceae cyanobacterium]